MGGSFCILFIDGEDLDGVGCAVLGFVQDKRHFGVHTCVYHEIIRFEQIKRSGDFIRMQRVVNRTDNTASPPDSLCCEDILNARGR